MKWDENTERRENIWLVEMPLHMHERWGEERRKTERMRKRGGTGKQQNEEGKETKVQIQLASIFSWCSSRRSLFFRILCFSSTFFHSFIFPLFLHLGKLSWISNSEKKTCKEKVKRGRRKVPLEWDRRSRRQMCTEKPSRYQPRNRLGK